MEFRQIISVFVIICMVAALMPSVVFSDSRDNMPAIWEAIRIETLTEDELAEGVIYMGVSGAAEEFP